MNQGLISGIKSDAIFSPNRKYRYLLLREWDQTRKYVWWIGLNPSTADESVDDPTIHRCIDFTRRWDFGGMYMLNLFAYRATDPKDLFKADDPIGPDGNKIFDHVLRAWKHNTIGKDDIFVACWGTHGTYRNRGHVIKQAFFGYKVDLRCLGLTKNGQPKHPLYIHHSAMPVHMGLENGMKGL